jgi:LacI family transcriptional regulator
MIVSVGDERHEPTIAELRRATCPIVTLDRELPEGVAAGDVRTAHAASAHLLAEHLAELGHRHVGLVAGDQRVRPARSLANGLIERCAELGVELTVVSGPYTELHGQTGTLQLLGAAPRPTAIVAAGSLLLLGALRALREQQLEIPRDISIVSTDGIAELEWFGPPITAIEPPVAALGVAVAELLLDAIGGHDAFAERELAARFVIRASTAPPASM